jgi:hypothetical protein
VPYGPSGMMQWQMLLPCHTQLHLSLSCRYESTVDGVISKAEFLDGLAALGLVGTEWFICSLFRPAVSRLNC